LNKTLAGLGQYDDAYKLLRQYIDLRDSLNNNESMQKLTSYNLELNFAARRQHLAQQEREKDILYQQHKAATADQRHLFSHHFGHDHHFGSLLQAKTQTAKSKRHA